MQQDTLEAVSDLNAQGFDEKCNENPGERTEASHEQKGLIMDEIHKLQREVESGNMDTLFDFACSLLRDEAKRLKDETQQQEGGEDEQV